MDGNFSLISPKGKTFGSKAVGDNVHMGPSIGGSGTWLEWSPKVWNTRPNINLVTGKLGGYTDINKNNFNIGGGAEIAATKLEIPFSFTIPFTDLKANASFEGSVLSAGLTGHVDINPNKGEFSLGGKTSVGAGAGFNFKISEEKKKK
ncbi:MAG: hypothetical protein LBI13_03425 [Streptococcaceae bacterium]|jgi:hypothetical protein|nr:hypothetical protein [Streptococcaceae bacterium]